MIPFAANAEANSGRRDHNVGIAWCARTSRTPPLIIYGGAATLLTRSGMKAELVVFDPTTVQDKADFQNPQRYAERIPLRDPCTEGRLSNSAKLTHERPGRILYGPAKL